MRRINDTSTTYSSVMFKLVILSLLLLLWCLLKIPAHMLETYSMPLWSQVTRACVLVLYLSTSVSYYVVAQYKGLHESCMCFCGRHFSFYCAYLNATNTHKHFYMHNLLPLNSKSLLSPGFICNFSEFDIWCANWVYSYYYWIWLVIFRFDHWLFGKMLRTLLILKRHQRYHVISKCEGKA